MSFLKNMNKMDITNKGNFHIYNKRLIQYFVCANYNRGHLTASEVRFFEVTFLSFEQKSILKIEFYSSNESGTHHSATAKVILLNFIKDNKLNTVNFTYSNY